MPQDPASAAWARRLLELNRKQQKAEEQPDPRMAEWARRQLSAYTQKKISEPAGAPGAAQFDLNRQVRTEQDWVAIQAEKLRARVQRQLKDQGHQVRREAFNPPIRGTRQFLHEYTKGTVDLTAQRLRHTTEEDLSSSYYDEYKRLHPTAASFIDPNPALRDRLAAHLKAVARLNDAPATPSEKLNAIEAARQDWTRALAGGQLRPSGLLSKKFGQPVALPGASKVPPELARDVFSKLIDTAPIGRPQQKAVGRLREEAPLGNEVAAYEALGGQEFHAFLWRHLPYYVARERWENLLGHKLPQDFLGQRPLAFNQRQLAVGGRTNDPAVDPIPTTPRQTFGLATLLEVSPFVALVTQASQRATADQALEDHQRYKTTLQHKGAIIGPLTAAWDAPGRPAVVESAERGGAILGGALNLLSFGAFSAFTRELSDIPESFSRGVDAARVARGYYFDGELPESGHRPGDGVRAFRNGRSWLMGQLAFTEPTENTLAMSRLKRQADILALFPEMSEEAKDRLNHEVYSFSSIISDRLAGAARYINKVPDVPLPKALADNPEAAFIKNPVRRLADFFGVNDPGFRAYVSNTMGGIVDDEGSLFLTATFLPLSNILRKGARKVAEAPSRLFNAVHNSRIKTRLARLARDVQKNSWKHHELLGTADAPELGQGAYSLADATHRSEMLGGLLDRMRREIPTTGEMRSMLGRLEETLRTERIPLDPDTEAWAHAGIARARERLEALSYGAEAKVPLDTLKAIHETVGPSLLDLPFFDRDFILSGEVRVLGPHASAEMVRRYKDWLEAARGTEVLPAAPRQLQITQGEHFKITRGLLAESDRLARGLDKARQVDTVLQDASLVLDERLGGHRRQLARLERDRDAAAAQFNDTITAEVERTARINREGGTVNVPNPALGTPLYARVEAALLDPTGTKLRNLLFDKTNHVRANVGRQFGAVLLRRLRELSRQERALIKQAVREKRSAGEALAVRREMEQIFRDHLSLWRERRLRLNEVHIPPAQTGAADATATALQEKTAAARAAGVPVQLTRDELRWLNQHRTRYKIPPVPATKTLLDRLEPLRRQIERQQKKLERLGVFRDTFDQNMAEVGAILDGTKKGPVKFTPGFTRLVSELFDDPAAKVFENARGGYFVVQDAPGGIERTGLEAWNEAIRDLTVEEKLIRNGTLDVSAAEYMMLPPAIANDMLRRAHWTADGLIETYKAEVRKLEKMGIKMTPGQRGKVFEALRAGNVTSDAMAQAIYNNRLSLLELMLENGLIGPDDFANLSGTSYYHGVYLDKEQRARLAFLEGQFDSYIPRRFAPLRVDPRALRFERPGDSWWVHYRINDQDRFKKGFAGPEDAAAFLETLPGTVDRAKIHPPVRFSDKVLEGLIEDPATNIKMTESLVQAINNHVMTNAVARTPFVKRADEAASFPDAEFSPSGSTAVIEGKHYVRWDDPRAPALHGKYVRSDVVSKLNQYGESFSWTKDLMDDITRAANADPHRNALLPAGTRALAGGLKAADFTLKAASTVWATVRIIPNFISWANGWLGNLLLYGPSTFASFGKSTGSRTWWKHGKEGTLDYIRGLASGEFRDPHVRELIANGNLQPFGDDVNFAAEFTQAIERHWESPAGLEARIEKAKQRRLAVTTPIEFAKWDAEVIRLENQFKESTRKQGWWKDWTGAARRAADKIFKGSTERLGLTKKAWDFYSIASGDVFAKIASYKKLRTEEGLSKAHALERIDTFFQHLHRVPRFVSAIGRRIEGAQFAGFSFDQGRRLYNAFRHNRGFMLQNLMQLYLYNTALHYAHGKDPNEHDEWWATRLGLKRSWWTSFLSRTSTVSVPFTNSEHGTALGKLDIGAAVYDWFGLQNPQYARRFRNLATEKGGLGMGSANLGLGLLNRWVGGTAALQFFGGFYSGRDELGDPINSWSDVASYTARHWLLPTFAPGGYYWNKIYRAFEGTEVDPSTLRARPPGEVLAETLLRVRADGDSLDLFKQAMWTHVRANGGGNSFLPNIDYDQLRSVQIARGAGRGDGTLDPDKAQAIAEDWYREHKATITTPDGRRVGHGQATQRQIKQALDAASRGTTREQFNNMTIPAMINVYANWRISHPRIQAGLDTELDNTLQDDILKRIQGMRFERAVLDEVRKAVDMYQARPDTPQDVQNSLRHWENLIVREAQEKLIR